MAGQARGCQATVNSLYLEQLVEGHNGSASPSPSRPESPRSPGGTTSPHATGAGIEDYRELTRARVPMLIAVSVLVYQFLVYNAVFLWRVLPAVGKSELVMPFLLMFNFLWGMSVWCYFRAHVADPGSVPKRWQEFVLTVQDALPIAPPRAEWQPGKATFCQKCRVPRPERAHHCSICGMCVLRMDHHCPWINNCVGFFNHKFFLLVGIYCCITCLVALVTAFPEIVLSVAVLFHMESFLTEEAKQIMMVDVIVLLVFGFLALLFFTLLTPMVASHFPLAQRNQTTIENYYDNMPNPFDQGSSLANLAQVFGDVGIDWLLPVAPLRPLSDGVSFARSDERLNAVGVPDLPELSGAEDEPQVERLWRMRYNVPSPLPATEKTEDAQPPLFFSRWWTWSTAGARRIVSL